MSILIWFSHLTPLMRVLLVGGAAIALLVFLVWSYGHWRRRRFARAARELGLTLAADGLSMQGDVRGLGVRIAHGLREVGIRKRTVSSNPFASKNLQPLYTRTERRPVRAWFTHISVKMDGSIRDDLRIRAVGRLGRVAAAFSDQPEWSLGAADVERAFDFEAGDVVRMRDTLRQPEVLEALRAIRKTSFDFEVESRHLRMAARGRVSSPRVLTRAVGELVTLGRALIDVQPRVQEQAPDRQR